MTKDRFFNFSPNLHIIWFAILLINLASFYLTFTFDWWENLHIKQIDYFLAIFSLFYFVFRKYFIVLLFLLSLSIFSNLHGLIPILANLLLFLFAFLIGFAFIKKIKVDYSNLISITTLSVGLGIISFIISLTSFFRINTPIFFFLLFSSLALISYLLNISFINKLFSNLKLKNLNFNMKFFNSSIFVFLFFYTFLVVLIPDSSHDGLSTHLTVPKQFFLNQYWEYNVDDYVWAVQPFGVQWLFSFLFFFGGEPSVKIFLLFILLFLTYFSFHFFIKRDFSKDVSIGLSLLIFSLPITLASINALHIDIVHAFFATAIFFEILNKERNWKIISVITGMTFAIKSSTILLIPLILHFYIFDNKKNFKIKNLIVCLIFGIIFSIIPYLVAFIKTGSPTFPLYNEIFRSDLISKEPFYHPIFSDQSFLDIFYTTFNSKNYGLYYQNGAIGLCFFIFGLIALLNFLKIEKEKYFLLFYYFLACACMFIFQSYLRYVYFLLPSILYLLIISINDNLKKKKIIFFTVIFILLINVVKYDKVFLPLKDDYKLYISKNKLIEYDLKQQPLKRLGNHLNKIQAFKDKKTFILTKYNQPQYYHFDFKVGFWSWHSLGIQMEIINKNNLEKALENKDYNFLIYSEDFERKTMSQFFEDNVDKIGQYHSKFENFIIKKLN